MDNFKVRTKSLEECSVVQDLMEKLGFKADIKTLSEYLFVKTEDGVSEVWNYVLHPECFELKTIDELKDMVVLKRNCVEDATHVDQYGDKWICASGVWYFYSSVGEWSSDCKNMMHRYDLKPIQKGEIVKEFLFKFNGHYTLCESDKELEELNPDQYIEVPDGADEFLEFKSISQFFKDNRSKYFSNTNQQWFDVGDTPLHSFNVVWQREKGYENKITSVDFDGGIVEQGYNPKESIIDKLVVDEVKHSHYKKDVSHLNVIDPYRISDLYALHPCAEHIMKKSLCAGNRGHKDTLRDIQDIIDTAERWKQMIKEDNNEI